MPLKTFRNELGNEITIETRAYHDDENACKMIEISIKGPRSESEWIITAEEALEVQRQINDAINDAISIPLNQSSFQTELLTAALMDLQARVLRIKAS